MNKGGRPEKEIKRNKRIQISITPKEFDDLNILYNNSKIYHSLNEMIRDILLNNKYETKTIDEKGYTESIILISSVRKIGNNFNQLLRHLNQKKLDNFGTDERNQIQFNLQEIRKIFISINEYIKKVV